MEKRKILGALVGDIIGSVYEFRNTKRTDFELFCNASTFTDDSVMTLAVAKWFLDDETHSPQQLVQCMQELGRRYPYAGYGGRFRVWLSEDNPQPYIEQAVVENVSRRPETTWPQPVSSLSHP